MKTRAMRYPRVDKSVVVTLLTQDTGSLCAELCDCIVLILVGNSEIGAHVRSHLCYLISLKHLIRSEKVTNLILFFGNNYFYPCVRNMF